MAFLSPHHDIRASDDDRERLADLLKAHFAAGRLDEAEFSARASAAYAAVYLSELDALTLDLPSLQAAVPTRRLPGARTAPSLTAALVLVGVVAVLAVLPASAWIALVFLALPLMIVLLFVVAPLALPLLAVAFVARAIFRAPPPRRRP